MSWSQTWRNQAAMLAMHQLPKRSWLPQINTPCWEQIVMHRRWSCDAVFCAELWKTGSSLDVEAFCKVASAWTELRDLGSRWRYDMELQAGRGNLSAGSPMPHKPPAMDVDKALGIFAFETWVCGKNTTPDFEPVLREAQELVDDSIATLPDSEVTATTVACGMAVSAGLLAAGCVASAAGYPTLGNYVRKGAVYQQSDLVQGQREEVPEDTSPDPWSLLFGGMSCLPCQRSCLYKAGKIIAKEKPLECSDGDEERSQHPRMFESSCLVILSGSCEACRQGLQGRLGEVVKASKGGRALGRRKRGKIVTVSKRNLELANVPWKLLKLLLLAEALTVE
eukprot:Skav216543  [mRNA]  locus=scaffold1776:169392:185115:+ [translate_table: standard]